MNKRIMRYFAAGLIGALLFGALPVFAANKATSSVSKVKSSVSKVLPKIGLKAAPKVPVKGVLGKTEPSNGQGIGLKITPGYWNGEDEITQLYGLTIKEISGDTIKVATERVYPCLRAEDMKKNIAEGVKPELVGPCPTVQEVLNIKISKETILLLRDRTRAKFSQFAVGEEINVYGFQNKDSVEALIVRNLDKPELIQPVELWDMEITSIKGDELTVKYNYNCKGQICPMMGAKEPAMDLKLENAKIAPPSMQMIYPMPRVVRIKSDTVFSDRNGNAVGYGDLKVGDVLNLSGTMRGRDPNAPVLATKIQNTSIPRTQNNLSIQSFNGPGKLQAGQTGQWNIAVSGGSQEFLGYFITWGDEKLIRGESAPSTMKGDRLNNGNFTHVYQNPGTYTLTITVTDASGASAKASMQVYVF